MVKVVAVVSSVLLFFLVFGFAASVEVSSHLAIQYREGGVMIMRYGTAQYSTSPISNPNKNYTTL